MREPDQQPGFIQRGLHVLTPLAAIAALNAGCNVPSGDIIEAKSALIFSQEQPTLITTQDPVFSLLYPQASEREKYTLAGAIDKEMQWFKHQALEQGHTEQSWQSAYEESKQRTLLYRNDIESAADMLGYNKNSFVKKIIPAEIFIKSDGRTDAETANGIGLLQMSPKQANETFQTLLDDADREETPGLLAARDSILTTNGGRIPDFTQQKNLLKNPGNAILLALQQYATLFKKLGNRPAAILAARFDEFDPKKPLPPYMQHYLFQLLAAYVTFFEENTTPEK